MKEEKEFVIQIFLGFFTGWATVSENWFHFKQTNAPSMAPRSYQACIDKCSQARRLSSKFRILHVPTGNVLPLDMLWDT